MKKDIGNSIKDSLEQFEVPYNPAAWKAMESVLDAKMPVTAAKKPVKWYYIAGTAAIICAAGYFAFNNSSSVKETVKTDKFSQEINQSQQNLTEESAPVLSSNNEVEENIATTSQVSINDETTELNPVELNSIEGAGQTNEELLDPIAESHGISGTETNTNEPQDNQSNERLTLAAINDVCLNEFVSIENKNSIDIIVQGPNMNYTIPKGESKRLRMSSDGLFEVVSSRDESVVLESFNVRPLPVGDITIDDYTKFENGIPTTILEANASGIENFAWQYDGIKMSGSNAKAHFYTQGNHKVSLTLTGVNGCSQTVTKNIYVEKAYNLLAENAFKPNSMDPLVNTFMPDALVHREVGFHMIIIDPSDGHVVFETTESSNGWNGLDSKTGQMVPFEQSYIWKVTLENRAINEKRNEYTGQIIPVRVSQ